MRIIAGIARGMTLAAPHGDATRPTSDRTREAVFSSLGARAVDAVALDLFAGTGGLGLEAASRGAKSLTFVENDRQALEILRRNIDTAKTYPGLDCELKLVRAEAFAAVRNFATSGERFSLVFADPPYGETAQTLLDTPEVRQILAESGLFVLESAKRDVLRVPESWAVTREAVYGDTRVTFLVVNG